MHPLVRLLAPRLSRRGSLLAVLLTAAVAIALLAAAPAGAVVTAVKTSKSGPTTTVGVQPHSVVLGTAGSEPVNFNNNSGNPVLHANNTYVVYWDPFDLYHSDWQRVIDTFMQRMGSASGDLQSVFAVDAQYTDKTNVPAAYRSRFRGAYTDTAAYPSPGCTDPNPLAEGDAVTCLSDKQVREQLESFISTHGLSKGMGTIFYMLTPPGVSVCVDEEAPSTHCSSNEGANSFCSYHSAIGNGDANTILYGMIPWSAGGLGNPLIAPKNRTKAFNCQDGGFDPSSKPVAEEKEETKEETALEKEAFEKATKKEKEHLKLVKELEGPHQQEPNQEPCPTVGDGGCDTGLADIIINQVASEQHNIVTNPLLDAWQDPKNNETTDLCRNFFALVRGGTVIANESSGAGTLFNQILAGGTYYLNDVFNLAATKLLYPGVGCLNHVNLIPDFTSPNPVNSGEIVGFDGMQSNVALNAAYNFPGGGPPAWTYATYTWNFGDGSPTVSGFAPGAPVCSAPWLSPCAGSAFHSYQYGGTYNVTLTITDVGGDTASTTNAVSVVGPAPPSPAATPTSTSPAATPAAAASPPPASPAVKPTVPKPVAAAAVVSRNLRSVSRNGLVVRYSVNEQVAGRFEVLLARSTARKLGIGGAPAFGLPPGSAPAVVIAKAFLVTTKAGRSTVVIKLSKNTNTRLARMPKVSLMLRLVVRNADPRSPASTTVLSPITLSR